MRASTEDLAFMCVNSVAEGSLRLSLWQDLVLPIQQAHSPFAEHDSARSTGFVVAQA